MENNKGKLDYYCQYCPFKCRLKETIIEHLIECKKRVSEQVEGVDFVICNICNFHAQNLSIHLKKIHKLDKTEYSGKLVSEQSSKSYSNAPNHLGYIAYAKEHNIDLTEYKQKLSEGVKNFLKDNVKESERRSKLMSQINQSDLMRKKSSVTAKKTSARPEIIKARSQRLAKWRKNHPKDFHDKCVNKMISSWYSKPETKLFEYVSNIDGFLFKRNQRVKSNTFLSQTKEKQIDICDKEKRIYIEFDGCLHFEPKFGNEVLTKNIIRDKLLDQHISNHNWTLIRVSYDQYISRVKQINKVKQDASYFKQECLDKIVEILNNNIPGIYKIGKAYGQH